MKKYVVAQHNRINTIDDINLHFYLTNTDTKEQSTVFIKADNLSTLTLSNNMYYIISALLSVNISYNIPDKIDISKSYNVDELDKVFCVIFRKENRSNVFYARYVSSNSLEDATALSQSIAEKYDNVDNASIAAIGMGNIIKSSNNKEFIKRNLVIKLDKQDMPQIIIKDGHDSFADYDRLVYNCSIEDEE